LRIQKNAWDASLPDEIADQWRKWEKGPPEALSVKRSIPLYKEVIDEIQLPHLVMAADVECVPQSTP